jgi:hypothetical protein
MHGWPAYFFPGCPWSHIEHTGGERVAAIRIGQTPALLEAADVG